MKKLLAVLLSLGFVGCATTPNLSNVSLGMTKAEVIKSLGNPSSVSAIDNVEYLKYTCSDSPAATMLFGVPGCNYRSHEQFVRLVNGKVESYGKVGDFDSAKNPAADVNLNVNSGGK